MTDSPQVKRLQKLLNMLFKEYTGHDLMGSELYSEFKGVMNNYLSSNNELGEPRSLFNITIGFPHPNVILSSVRLRDERTSTLMIHSISRGILEGIRFYLLSLDDEFLDVDIGEVWKLHYNDREKEDLDSNMILPHFKYITIGRDSFADVNKSFLEIKKLLDMVWKDGMGMYQIPKGKLKSMMELSDL